MHLQTLKTLAIVILITMGTHLVAQNPNAQQKNKNTPKETRFSLSDRAERMAKQLNLTDSEKMELELYFLNVEKRREETLDKIKKLAKNDKSREEILNTEKIRNDNELRSIIGSAKMEKYIQMRENREHKRRNK